MMDTAREMIGYNGTKDKGLLMAAWQRYEMGDAGKESQWRTMEDVSRIFSWPRPSLLCTLPSSTKPALFLDSEAATDDVGQILLSVRPCRTAGHESCYLCAPGRFIRG